MASGELAALLKQEIALVEKILECQASVYSTVRILWENGPMLVKEMLEYYPEPRPHVNTVSTVIRVLEKKGYVGHEKEVGTYRYHAILEKDSYRKASLMTILRNYFDNSLKSMVSALVQDEDLSEEDIKECIDIIERNRNH